MDPSAEGVKQQNTKYSLARIAHLQRFFGMGATVAASGPLRLIYPASAIDAAEEERLLHAMARVHDGLLDWCHQIHLHPPRPDSELIIGLASDRLQYELYLKQEALEGLKGSLGLTHPVRLSSVAQVDRKELKSFELAVVAAHEMIHQFTVVSGLCPGWDAWPRWLHEGFAMLGDHTATSRVGANPFSQSYLDPTGFGAINPERNAAWKKIAAGFEMKSFLKRDLLKNPLSHVSDYAACWAITHALAHWQNGEILTDLIEFLNIQQMQPESDLSIEIITAEWLLKQFGDQWPDFVKFMIHQKS
jgi:hypothetical protein